MPVFGRDGLRLMVSRAGTPSSDSRRILPFCSGSAAAGCHQTVIVRIGESPASRAKSAEVTTSQALVAAGKPKDELPENVEPAECGVKHRDEVQIKEFGDRKQL